MIIIIIFKSLPPMRHKLFGGHPGIILRCYRECNGSVKTHPSSVLSRSSINITLRKPRSSLPGISMASSWTITDSPIAFPNPSKALDLRKQAFSCNGLSLGTACVSRSVNSQRPRYVHLYLYLYIYICKYIYIYIYFLCERFSPSLLKTCVTYHI